MDEADLFWITGLLHGRMPQLAPKVRCAIDLALVDMAWRAFVRDAGARDDDGLDQASRPDDDVLRTTDPRAGAVAAFLASKAGPLQSAAKTIQLARGASGCRFSPEERAMLESARAALTTARVSLRSGPPHNRLLAAVRSLRTDWRFICPPPGRGPEAGGAWAVNLALLTMTSPAPVPGIVSRAIFRDDLELRTAPLIASWSKAAHAVQERVISIGQRLQSANERMADVPVNSRAHDLAGPLAAIGALHRSSIKRGWQLSDAGVTLVMRKLADLGIALQDRNGTISWHHSPQVQSEMPPSNSDREIVLSDLADAVALADKVLAKVARSRD
jgi:hypothetical protein